MFPYIPTSATVYNMFLVPILIYYVQTFLCSLDMIEVRTVGSFDWIMQRVLFWVSFSFSSLSLKAMTTSKHSVLSYVLIKEFKLSRHLGIFQSSQVDWNMWRSKSSQSHRPSPHEQLKTDFLLIVSHKPIFSSTMPDSCTLLWRLIQKLYVVTYVA